MMSNKTYNNKVLNTLDTFPIASFFVVPVLLGLAGKQVALMIRRAKYGDSMLGNIFASEKEVSPFEGIGTVIRTEGGSPEDLMFRATASDRPTDPGLTAYEAIHPMSQGTPVRYDRNYHDTIFFPNLDYKDNKQVIDQSFSPKVTDSYVFAGIGGLNKLNMR